MVFDLRKKRRIAIEVAWLSQAFQVRRRMREQQSFVRRRRWYSPLPIRMSRAKLGDRSGDPRRLLWTQRRSVISALRIMKNEHDDCLQEGAKLPQIQTSDEFYLLRSEEVFAAITR